MANKLIEDIWIECARVRDIIVPAHEATGDIAGAKKMLEIIEGAEASTFDTSDRAILLQAGALAVLRKIK
jgi:hypothetical protein